jgi:hypothetical protein
MKKTILVASIAAAFALAIASLSSEADRMSPQGGTITSVVAGTGLTGGASSGPATLNVGCGNGLSCASDSLTVNNGTGLTFSGGALTYDNTVIQSRVSGACSSGFAIGSVNADGTVSCNSAGGLSGMSTNAIQKATSPTAIGDSSITDNGTTIAVNTNKVTITESNGNTSIAGTLLVSGTASFNSSTTISGALSATTVGSGVPFTATYNGAAQTANRTTASIVDTATFDTTSSSLTTYGVNSNVTASRSAGALDLVNVALYGNAQNAQQNFALVTDAGDIDLNRAGGATTVHGNTSLGDASADTFTVTSSAPRFTCSANDTRVRIENTSAGGRMFDLGVSGSSGTPASSFYLMDSTGGGGSVRMRTTSTGATTFTANQAATPLTVSDAYTAQANNETLFSVAETGTFDTSAAPRSVIGEDVTVSAAATSINNALNRTGVRITVDPGAGGGSGDINTGLEVGASGGTTNYSLHATNGNVLIDNNLNVAGTTTLTGNVTSQAITTVAQLVLGVLSPASISGVTNDWNPTNLAVATVIRISTSALTDLSGLQGGTGGRRLTLTNISSNTIRVWNEDTRSSAANRFALGDDEITIGPSDSLDLVYDGTSSRWRLVGQSRMPNTYGGVHYEWNEDFIGSVTANTTFFTCNNTGTGSSCGQTSTSAAFSRPGWAEMATGTTTTGRAGIQTGFTIADFTSGAWHEATSFGFPTLSTVTDAYAATIGFTDAITINQVDGCWFQYDNQNVATAPGTGNANSATTDKLECWCAANSTRTGYIMDGTTVSDGSFTTVNTPVAALTYPSTNLMRGRIVMTGAKAEFYIDSGSGFTKRCEITSNIPNATARATGYNANIVKSAGTTSRILAVDQVHLAVDLNAVRSP